MNPAADQICVEEYTVKKAYKTPSAEKIEFDYGESVEACSPNCNVPWHWWHQQQSNVNPNPATSVPTSGTNEPTKSDPYYAPGWGQNC